MPESKLQPTIVDFLRHGDVLGENCFRGVTDDPLTEQGWQQMYQQCQGRHWQALISSPLRRCASFAAVWAQEHQLPWVNEPNLMEIDFGDWEGQTAEQISRYAPNALNKFYLDPAGFTPPNAESYAHFAQRIQQAWDKVITQYAGQHVLVITHAGVIRLLFSQLLGITPQQSFQIEVPHACLSRFSCFDDEVGRFVQLNFHKPV
jgi:alpha-ribazole phosphatase